MNDKIPERLHKHFVEALENRQILYLIIQGLNKSTVTIRTNEDFSRIEFRAEKLALDKEDGQLFTHVENATYTMAPVSLGLFSCLYGIHLGYVQIKHVESISCKVSTKVDDNRQIRIYRYRRNEDLFHGFLDGCAFGVPEVGFQKGEVAKGEDPDQMVCDLIQRAKEGKRYAGYKEDLIN